jgi:glycosyltransferase involved in cell wall biosynthesis
MLIVIPTRNRIKELTHTLNFLESNKFFFEKIVIVDSSNLEIKNKINEKVKKYSANIKIVNSEASTCIQRNVGFDFIEKSKYIMFLDDDNIFYPDAFYKMQNFLNNNKDFVGVAFNQIYKEKKNILDIFKKNYITNKIGIYSLDNGGFSTSGWQTRFVNFKNDEIVQWLPTRAVIYKCSVIKNARFDNKLGVYGYLEDLDFSLELKKKGNLMVCSDAKYKHDQSINRPGFQFGKKELRNRYYIVKKHKLNKNLFFVTTFLRMLLTFKEGVLGNLNSFQRLAGNLVALITINNLDENC